MATATTLVVIDWITGLGWDTTQETGYPLYPPPQLPSPDRFVLITGSGGPGYVTEEGAGDAGTFQTRLRGPADDPYEAEEKARELDRLILGASFPASVDGVRISHIHRLGGPPTPLPVDPADLRHEFTTNYVIIRGD